MHTTYKKTTTYFIALLLYYFIGEPIEAFLSYWVQSVGDYSETWIRQLWFVGT